MDHLKIIGAVGIGVAFVQVSKKKLKKVIFNIVLTHRFNKCAYLHGEKSSAKLCFYFPLFNPQIFGMVFTCCLYRNLKAEPY